MIANIPFIQSEIGWPGENRDCSVRALSICRNILYSEAHHLLTLAGRKPRRGMPFKLWGAYLDTLGIEQRPDLSCMTLAKALPDMQTGRFICRISGHFFAVVDGVVCDRFAQKPGCRLMMVYQPKI